MTGKEDLDAFLSAWKSNATNYAPRGLLAAQLLRACEEIEILMTTLYDYEALQKENIKLKEIIERLLEGLDANNDFDAGLTDKQWAERIKEAREAVK
jgi:hypothetical protein